MTDVATLEERVDRLEQRVQQIEHTGIDAGLRAQAYGLSLVQTEVATLRAEVADMRDSVDQRLTAIEAGLAQILQRLGGDGS